MKQLSKWEEDDLGGMSWLFLDAVRLLVDLEVPKKKPQAEEKREDERRAG